MDALPANQLALAATFKAVSRGRPKPMRAHLADAEIIMTELRQRGFRLVPFPPIKSVKLRAVAEAQQGKYMRKARRKSLSRVT
jgi:hypothetical protein